MVHVDDAVRAYMSCLTHKNARGVYNVAGQNNITSKDIAEIIATRLQCKTVSVPLEEAEKLFGPFIAQSSSTNSQANTSKAQHDLDWQPQHTNFHKEV